MERARLTVVKLATVACVWIATALAGCGSEEEGLTGEALSVDAAEDTAFVPAAEDAAAPSGATDGALDATRETGADARTALDLLCDGVATVPFDPPVKCDGPNGTTSTEIPVNGVYATSWFGCYRKTDGTIYKDPTDNCEFACGPRGLCPSTQSGPECEAALKWFAADADRYGCGARIRVTNCVNKKQVILTTLDRGPNCTSVEKNYAAPVLDMSYPAMMWLFDGKEYGGFDRKRVVVEPVSATTPLGPL